MWSCCTTTVTELHPDVAPLVNTSQGKGLKLSEKWQRKSSTGQQECEGSKGLHALSSWYLPGATSDSTGVASSRGTSSTFTNGVLTFSDGSLATREASLSGSFLSGSLLTGRTLPGEAGRTWAGLTLPGGRADAGLGVPGKWGKDLDGILENKQMEKGGGTHHHNRLSRTFLPSRSGITAWKRDKII